ncbi:unnamed protein product [Rhizopus microsporus]
MFTRPLACRLHSLRTYATKRKVIKENKDAIELQEAFRILKALEVGNPNHQIEAHVQCKIEKSTPLIRGSLVLPKSIKQEPTVLVFATGKKAEEAKAAGAQIVGGEELIEQIKAGELKFDKCIATPQMFPAVTKIAKILGPKNLCQLSRKSLFDFKADKHGVLHTGIGKVHFQSTDLEANLKAILEELRAFGKANNLKAIIQNVVVSSTRGPGIAVAGGSSL